MLNVGILGAGMMGRVHCNSYANVRGAKVAAVCDISEEKAKTVASSCNAGAYSDFDSMLNSESLDIVDICLPTVMHREFALKAINRGIHVFCEKPIASCIEDAKAMIKAANEKHVKFTVGHVVRFFPAYSKAAGTVAEGKIGTPKLIRTTRTGAFPSMGAQNWYADPELSGGVLLDLVIHDFDWIRHNFGEVERVYAKNLYSKGIKGRDHCLVTLRLKSGAIAHVEGSWAYPTGSVFGSTFEIIGTKGQIEYDSRSSVPVRKHLQYNDTVRIVNDSPVFSCDEPYTLELQEFVDSIIQDRRPCIEAEDALKALEISTAAMKSAISGNVVTIGGDQQ
jgi:UDP-N-acetylglucosamine 3-dehydrogenase